MANIWGDLDLCVDKISKLVMSSAIYKTLIISVGKFVPERLQPFWKHPAGW